MMTIFFVNDPQNAESSGFFVAMTFFLGSGYFASRGKIAPCYFAIWRQNSPNGYFAASGKIALSLMLTLTQTLTLILTLIPTLALTLTQTEEKHYFASRGKISTSFFLLEITLKIAENTGSAA